MIRGGVTPSTVIEDVATTSLLMKIGACRGDDGSAGGRRERG